MLKYRYSVVRLTAYAIGNANTMPKIKKQLNIFLNKQVEIRSKKL